MLERTSNKTAISPAEYREAMSHFAGAVNVVTTDGSAGRRGLTVSAAVSVSDDPATMIICLNRNRQENRAFEENGCFAVNTLCESHIEIARAFAGEGHLSMDDRFALAEWTTLGTNAPILKGARMALDCQVIDVQPVHTHYVVYGRVVDRGELRHEPALLYLDRDYRTA